MKQEAFQNPFNEIWERYQQWCAQKGRHALHGDAWEGFLNGYQAVLKGETPMSTMTKDGKELAPHQQRVVTEKQELDEKVERLAAFISESPTYQTLSTDEQKRLAEQHHYMKNYSDILGARIAAF